MHFPGHDVNGASPRRKAKVFKIRQRKILSLSLSSRGARFGRAITRHVARPTFPANQKNPHSADLIELSLTTRNVLPLSLITAYLSTTIRRSFFFFFSFFLFLSFFLFSSAVSAFLPAFFDARTPICLKRCSSMFALFSFLFKGQEIVGVSRGWGYNTASVYRIFEILRRFFSRNERIICKW